MNRFKNYLIVAAVFALLWGIGTIMNSRPSVLQAAGGPSVTIDPTQLPLPVQGTTTVSGTVAATQSGTWNIGITGTPTVNLAGTPAVSVTGTPNVTVANQATTPVLSLNVGDTGRIPYQSTQPTISCSPGGCSGVFPAVPPGHRLVVQHLSGALILNGPPTFVSVFLSIVNNTRPVFSTFFTPINMNQSHFDQAVLAYYDAGQVPDVDLNWGGAGNPIELLAALMLTGYLVDCTIGPCAAIAQ